ncbi:MAG: DUF445 family protein [Phycisphaeraceae bacterium]|nr:DUF445 family protein [Phycisphaeraceae bacterium]
MTPTEVQNLLQLCRQAPTPVGRRWAVMQLTCIAIVWLTLAMMAVMIIGQFAGWFHPVHGIGKHLLLGLIGASVGFLTNYIAIQMLFQPEDGGQNHWLRVLTLGLWRQGLVPRRRRELARRIGDLVEAELLTPRKLVDELSRVIDALLADEAFRTGLRKDIETFLRRALPAIVDRLTPELMGMFSKALTESLDQKTLARFLESVIEPEVRDNREEIAAFLAQLLQRRAPEIRRFAQRQIEKRGFWAKLATGILETVNLIDWNRLERTIAQELGSHETREQIKALVMNATESLRDEIRENPKFTAMVDRLRPRLETEAREMVGRFLSHHLPDAIQKLLNSQTFWEWFQGEGLTVFQEEVRSWLDTHGVDRLAPRFEIGRRVEEAVNELDIRQLNEQVNKVAADQLGGIQVLGFVLGGILGLLAPLALG